MVLRRAIFILVLVCLGCSAQSVPSDQAQRIERQVRAYYSVPSSVKVSLGTLHASEFPNYDALTIHIEGNGKERDYDFLLSKDGKTLLRMTKLDLTKDPYSEAMSKIDISGRPVRGNKDAKVLVVNYDDLECPFCSKMHQVLFPEILKEYGDRVRFVYKDFPIPEIHPWAMHAAVDANCLAAQNPDAYWDFADYIHANQREVSAAGPRDAQYAALDRIATDQGQKHNVDKAALQACMKAQKEDQIRTEIREGENLNVSATPTIFVNGEEVDGALPIEEFRATLDRALQQAGVPAPAHPSGQAASGSGPASK
jgi:protein-disulfide isomerase